MKKNILATLIYSDIFNYPLKSDEIFNWLIKELGDKSDPISKNLDLELKKLVKEKKLETKNGYYFLPGRGKIVEFRKRREGWSKIKFEKAKAIALFLKLLPWIKFIGISGGLARNNADQDDDIDFFFITSKKRIWISRAFVVLFLTSFGWYRRPKNISDKICPNFFIDEEHLEISTHDLYTAHEVAQVKSLYDNNIHHRFLKANNWIKEYLPNSIPKYNDTTIRRYKSKNIFFISKLLDVIEELVMWFQLKYMASKKTSEETTPFLIKFHPSDIHNIVLKKFSQRMATAIEV